MLDADAALVKHPLILAWHGRTGFELYRAWYAQQCQMYLIKSKSVGLRLYPHMPCCLDTTHEPPNHRTSAIKTSRLPKLPRKENPNVSALNLP